MIDLFRQRAVLRALTACTALPLALAAWPALAQQPAPKPASAPAAAKVAEAAPEEIVITGSRIKRPNLTQPTPVTVFNAEAIKLTGVLSTIDVISQLPQGQNNMTAATATRFINGAGVNFANLRGLGEYRTLTLVDGKRHIGSLSGRNASGGTSLVDLNSIAPALIDRIDIVTGGTSAVYGADAVAGVVNVILKKNYQGAELTVQHNRSGTAGFESTDVNGIIGTNFANDRGNITFAFDRNDDKGLFGKDRAQALYNYSLLANPKNTGANDGIPDRITVAPTLSSVFAASGSPVIRTRIGNTPQYTLAFKTDGTGLIPFNRGVLLNPPVGNTSAGDTVSIGGDGENLSKYLTLRTPNLRQVAETRVNYEIARGLGPIATINFFGSAKYSDTQGYTQSTPMSNGTGNPGTGTNLVSATGALQIQADNPYIPTDLAQLLTANRLTNFTMTRLNSDWARNRQYNFEYQVARVVAGFDGELTNGWKYELFYNYGRNRTDFVNTDRQQVNFVAQIDSIKLADGTIVCRDPVQRALGCVPINPFKVGPLTAAQYNYAYTYTKEQAILTQENIGGQLSGDLFSYKTLFSGTSAPIGFAMGFEYRNEDTNDKTDPLANAPSGFIYGNQNGSVVGKYSVNEGFGELSLPLLRDLPYVKALDVDVAYRYSSYSTSGPANTWNVMGAWAVNDSFKLRSGLARAVRAPNIDDLFSPAGDNFLAVSDPCSIEQINSGGPSRLANCRAAGVPVGYKSTDFGNPSVRTGGNPLLKPEIGTTVTAGVVLTPTFIPGFSATLDYWQVKIRAGQAAIDQNSILTNCYDSGVAAQCGLVTRRADGSIFRINGTTVNLGREKVSGVDLGMSYNFGLEKVGLANAGDMTLGFDGTYAPQNYILQNPAQLTSKLYRAGTAGYPKVKFNMRASWDQGPITLSWSGRYLGESDMFPNTPAEIADFSKVPSVFYNDISARYRWRNLTFFGGINNLADQGPPNLPFLYQGSYQGGAYATFPVTTGAGGSYDIVGRVFYFGATVKY